MKKLTIGIIIVLSGFVGYVFLFGKLFAYSPIIIGFTKHELTNSIIYVQNGAVFNGYTEIDTLLPPVENFHELKFIQKPELFVFRDSITYIRHSISKARFSAYTSGRLFISPWAQKEAKEKKILMEIYLKHELSHVLIFQHKGIIAGLRYPDWLLEGIAVFSANQMGTSFYPGKDETFHAIALGNFIPPFDFKTKREDSYKLDVKHRITFMYSEFACIVDYLVSSYGKAKFLTYMNGLIKDNDHNKIFKQVYGLDFEKFLVDFKQFVVKSDNLRTRKQRQQDITIAHK